MTLSGGEGWQWWDPQSASVRAVTGEGMIPLRLESYGGVFLCSTRGPPASTERATEVRLPRLTSRSLMTGDPVVARGEYVREQLQSTPTGRTDQDKAWTAAARLIRSQVDTYLFLRFPVNIADRDWSSTTCLVLDSTVPEAQRAAAGLLVILKEAGGAEYLASSGRSLGVAGTRTTHLFWTQFHLAGWSADPNDRLDLDQIAEVRVGWGGTSARRARR